MRCRAPEAVLGLALVLPWPAACSSDGTGDGSGDDGSGSDDGHTGGDGGTNGSDGTGGDGGTSGGSDGDGSGGGSGDGTGDDGGDDGYDACAVEYEPTIYVDVELGSDCDTYDPATRTCGAGSFDAFATLAGASAVAAAGDGVVIRAGTYQEPLVVQSSGTPDAYLVFAVEEGEVVTITNPDLEPAVDLSGQSHVFLSGLAVDNVRRWLYARGTSNSVLCHNTFTRALDPGGSSKTGLFFEEANDNKIISNQIEDSTQDNLALHACDRNVIEGNTIRKAAHTLWAIKCGNYNVVRGNYFENEDQKIGEIYDCDASGFDHQITAFDATRRNLVEDNEFALAVKYYSTSGGNGIQNAGQYGIFRNNVFHDTNAGLGLQRYSDEANFDTHNRVYNNTFYANECGGTGLGSGTPEQFEDNLFVNNIFFANVGCEGVGRAQIIYRDLAGFSFRNNAIMGEATGDPVIQELFGSGDTLAWFEVNHPTLFAANLEQDPMFVDQEGGDLQLDPNSPMVDAGRFLTSTVGAGQGTSMQVVDSGWFYDGYGIEGERGDLVQLENGTETARIVGIDGDTHTLTLDTSLVWEDGVGVSRAYGGSAPDIGAFAD